MSETETPNFHVICHIHDPKRRGTPHTAMMKFGEYVPSYEAAEWLETTGFQYRYSSFRPPVAKSAEWMTDPELWFHFFSLYEAQLFAMAFGMTVEEHDG